MTATLMPPQEQTIDPRVGGDPAALAAYYADKRLLWRNVAMILLSSIGHGVCFTVVGPLMQLRMNEAGLSEGTIGAINSANAWAVSFLVMYFAWKSDHLVSAWGRRVPFLFISAPFIIISIALFPFFDSKWILLALMVVQMFFLDMKGSTIPLLSIDCVPRNVLGRVNSISAIAMSLAGFLALRYGVRLADYDERLPYLLGAGLLAVTTVVAGLFIVEPPIRNPATERFKPWSAIKVGWHDRRAIILMLGVAMINSFMVMYAVWLWLFAKNHLGLSRTGSADALSWSVLLGVVLAYPTGWAIDRWGSYKVVILFWLMQIATCCVLLTITDSPGLVAVSILASIAAPLYASADIMVYKSSPPADVGSVTSTNAFVRNAFNGCLIFASGYLIDFTGSYAYAYIGGMILSTIGLVMFAIHWRLMRPSVEPQINTDSHR